MKKTLVVLCVGTLLGWAASPADATPQKYPAVVEREVRFQVEIPPVHTGPGCLHPQVLIAPKGSYSLVADLIAPRALVQNGSLRAGTVYLAGSGTPGDLFWHLQDPPGYDYATRQAQDGHASIVLDLLGYGRSDVPDGNSLCTGAEANVIAQALAKLKKGDYLVAGPTEPIAFERLVLVGHSYGGARAEVVAWAHNEEPELIGGRRLLDALVVASWTDTGTAPNYSFVPKAFFENHVRPCATGDAQMKHGAPNYATFLGPDELQHLARGGDPPYPVDVQIDDAVVDAFVQRYERDPCGLAHSAVEAIAMNFANLARIKVPVRVIVGEHDVFNDPIMALFGSADIEDPHIVDDAGHLLTLGATREDFRAQMSKWLDNWLDDWGL